MPWFGLFPEWMPYYEANIERLVKLGYDFLFDQDVEKFRWRVWRKIGIKAPIVAGEGKVHDYRATFGVLYEDELRGYDFWGHTDPDCVYGRVDEFVTDEFLKDIDIHSNHVDYVCGPWTLYRNRLDVNELFWQTSEWEENLLNPCVTGWVEKGYTAEVDARHAAGQLNRIYTMWQTSNLNDFSTLHFDGDRLLEGENEVMMAHFRRTKVYPEGCK